MPRGTGRVRARPVYEAGQGKRAMLAGHIAQLGMHVQGQTLDCRRPRGPAVELGTSEQEGLGQEGERTAHVQALQSFVHRCMAAALLLECDKEGQQACTAHVQHVWAGLGREAQAAALAPLFRLCDGYGLQSLRSYLLSQPRLAALRRLCKEKERQSKSNVVQQAVAPPPLPPSPLASGAGALPVPPPLLVPPHPARQARQVTGATSVLPRPTIKASRQSAAANVSVQPPVLPVLLVRVSK